MIRDRVKELCRVRAGDVRPHPRNWRTHPPEQRAALASVLAEIGFAGALLAREDEEGRLELIDGHLRAETSPDEIVPVLVVDLDAKEADQLLVVHDPLSALAGVDGSRLSELLQCVTFEQPAIEDLLASLRKNADEVLGAAAQRDHELPNVVIPEAYQLIVQCKDEADQQGLYEHLREKGYRCRVLTLS
jgi:hypothetical protein